MQSDKVVSARAAAGFRLREVRGVTLDVQDHAVGGVANGCVRASGGIFDQLQGFVVCFVGALELGCSCGTMGGKHGDVYNNHTVEEIPGNLLYKADSIWRKRGGVVKIVCVLDFGAKNGLHPGVGGILSAFGEGMLEIVQYFVDLA